MLREMLAWCDPDTGLPAIFMACQRGSASAVEQLCYAGANVQHVDASGRSLYHHLAACIAKLYPHTVLVVAAASCGLPFQQPQGTKCVVARAPHGKELFIPKGMCLIFRGEHEAHCFLIYRSLQIIYDGSFANATTRATLRCTRRFSSSGHVRSHHFCCSVRRTRVCSPQSSLSRRKTASHRILTAQNNLGMNALHELVVLSRAPVSRLNQRQYSDAIQHICRPSCSFVAACLQCDTAGKSPLHLACDLPSKGLLHALLGAAHAQAPAHTMWSYKATSQFSALRDEISLFVGGCETCLVASKSVACQTTLRGCWCCSRCKNCLRGLPCAGSST
jgi:hypothetical protein